MPPEYFFREGCHISEWANSELDPECSIARARVEPGQTTRWHFLRGTTERYVVLSGEGLVELESTGPQKVGPGDVVLIPPLVAQRITNTGLQDLVFLAICTPRFVSGCYEEMKES
jgi:mannose-6-phosphate isomerase-like protein (cupin superfamily)